jgi:hypothetical protein
MSNPRGKRMQIGEQLLRVDRGVLLGRFDFNEQCVFDDQIGSKGIVYDDAIGAEGNRNLTLDRQSS